jgi:glycosyltransferase involved in cell wall biosynthesis
MRKLSVAYLVPSLDYGGSETLLLSFLRNLDREKFSPEVHCFYQAGKLAREFRDEGIPVHEWDASRRNPVTFARLVLFMLRKRYDVAHTHLFDRQGRLAAFLARIPVIMTTYHLVTDWDGTGRFSDWLKITIDRLTARLNDKIIVVSEDVRKMAIEKGRLPEDRIVLVRNGIDVESYRDTGGEEELREELGLNGKRVVLAVGRLFEQKGHIYLIKAARILKEEFPDLVVVIVGEGPLKASLASEIRESKLEDNVILSGPRRDIQELLAMSEMFVMPSLYEGLPIALLEAMASGKPIVATDVDGIRGVIEKGISGLLVPPQEESQLAKAISILLTDKQLATSLATSSRERAEREFDIRLHVKKIEGIYMEIAADKGISNLI